MANPAPVAPASTEPKGAPPMRSLVAGLFPPDLGADNATDIARANLDRVKSKSTAPMAPAAPAKVLPPESPQLKALEAFSNPKPGEPALSVVKPGGEAPTEVKPATPAEPVPVPAVEPSPAPEAKLSDNLPDPGFADENLLSALEGKPVPKVEIGHSAESPTEEIVEDADAPVIIPKKAEELQAALIKTSKLLREKSKLIKELQAKGSIDVAAVAVEPLQQRIKALEAEQQQLLNVAASANLEMLPDIQANLVRPLQAAEAFVNEIARNNEGVSARDLFAASQEPDRTKRHAAIRAATADLHPADALQVEQAVDAIQQLGSDLRAKKGNAAQIMADRQKQFQEQQLANQATMRAQSVQAHDRIFKELFTDNPVLNQFAEADPEVKKKLGLVLDTAKQAELDTRWVANHEERARLMQRGFALPVVEKLYQNKMHTLLTEIKKLRAENLNLRGPSGLSTGPRTNYAQPAPANDGKPQSVADIVKGTFAGKI